MTAPTGRKRMGWLGWTGAVVFALALGGGGLLWAAADRDPAGTLTAWDARFSRERDAVLVAKAKYGTDPAQKLALYVPQGDAPAGGFPLVVFFHGGGWHSGDPYAYAWIARALAEKGYASALVGYRLNKPGRFPNMLLDSAAGTQWVVEHAGTHRIDVRRAALMGHSAGAYNATMLALERRWLADQGVPEGFVAGAVVLAGPSDFYPFDKKSSINAMSHWPRPQETQPVNYVRADAPPLLLVHGTEDTVVRPRNARILARTMTAAGVPTKPVLFEGMSHNDLILKLARPFDRDRRVIDAVFPFLDQVLRTDPPLQRASARVQPGGA